jgi:murein DD-endopeptidase MepM/ murein hydrolase activator NlpD
MNEPGSRGWSGRRFAAGVAVVALAVAAWGAADTPGGVDVVSALEPVQPLPAPEPAVLEGIDLAALLDRVGEVAAAGTSGDEGRRGGRSVMTPALAPAAGRVSSVFDAARRHPVLDVVRPHRGLDIAAPEGTPIRATAAGTVRFAGEGPRTYGLMVEIDHGYGLVTRFAHASRLHARAGDQVQAGQVIARVGSTGLVTGPHLHYEVLLDGRQLDPVLFLPPGTVPPRTADTDSATANARIASDD